MELRVRRGKGGTSTSPTTTAGYVWQVLAVLALLCAWAYAVLSGVDALLLIITGSVLAPVVAIVIRDAVAWFTATDEERMWFRAEVAAHRSGRDF